jgi:hypothetical protein
MCSIAKLLQETVEHRVLVVDFTAQCDVVSHPELVLAQEDRHSRACFREPHIAPALRDIAGDVCTENLSANVMVMESAKDGARYDASGPLNWARDRRIFIQ